MKKVLLTLLCSAGLTAMAQTFTVDDTLSTGDSQIFYTADSNATSYDNITGSGVTWDYSGLLGYPGAENLDSIKDASTSPDFADYPNADYWDDLANGASIFFSNTADSVISYGYIFVIDGNLVKVKHDIDPLKMLALPMALNDTYTDSIYGTADVYGNASDTEGIATVTADGTGTLLLGDSTFTNVIRIKTVETLEAIITLPPPLPSPVNGTVTRTDYRYYQLSSQNEPLFIHGGVAVTSNLFNGGYTAVYSSVELGDLGASIEESEIDVFSVYPNPANEVVKIISDQADEIRIMNALGQRIQVIQKPASTQTVETADFEKGVYFIQLNKGNATKTKKLIIK